MNRSVRLAFMRGLNDVCEPEFGIYCYSGPQAQMELIRLREEEEHMVLDLSVYQSTNSQQVVHGR